MQVAPLRRCAWTASRLGPAALLAAAALGVSCGTLSSRIVTDPAPSVARLRAGGSIQAEVDRLAGPILASGEACSLAVGVVTPDGTTQVFGYGRAERADGAGPPAGDTVFEVGSLSKLFVAALLAVLVDEGTLRYTDTVREILPPSIPLSADAGAITLQELVTHTSGLPREPRTFIQFHHFMTFLFSGHDLYRYIDQPTLYAYLRTLRLPPKSTRGYIYSNLGVGLLAHLIEVKTGRSLTDLMSEKICRPLGLRDTGYILDTAQRARLAAGHAGDQPRFMLRNARVPDWDMGRIMRPAGGLYSTADDLLTFAKANLGLAHHPLEPLLAATHRVQVVTPAEDVAYGWLINRFEGGRRTILYMHGMIAGYNAYLGMDPHARVAVVVLSGNFNWHDKIGHNLVLRLGGRYATAAAGPHHDGARPTP